MQCSGKEENLMGGGKISGNIEEDTIQMPDIANLCDNFECRQRSLCPIHKLHSLQLTRYPTNPLYRRQNCHGPIPDKALPIDSQERRKLHLTGCRGINPCAYTLHTQESPATPPDQTYITPHPNRERVIERICIPTGDQRNIGDTAVPKIERGFGAGEESAWGGRDRTVGEGEGVVETFAA